MSTKRVAPATLTAGDSIIVGNGKVVPVTEVKLVDNKAVGVYLPGRKVDMDRLIAVHITYYVDLNTSYTFVREPNHTVVVPA